jgi:hypothetical protein
MYDQPIRLRAISLVAHGESLRAVSSATGIARSTLRDWRDNPEKLGPSRKGACPRCSEVRSTAEPQGDYAYLLGLYLGDGCISRQGPARKDVWKLRIMCADAWPGLQEECKQAMLAVRPGNSVMTVQRDGCVEVFSYSKHWPCLFPQHGPGRKHERTIELESWQQEIVDSHPGEFARGSSTPTDADLPTGYGARSKTETAGMSTRGTCS